MVLPAMGLATQGRLAGLAHGAAGSATDGEVAGEAGDEDGASAAAALDDVGLGRRAAYGVGVEEVGVRRVNGDAARHARDVQRALERGG